MTISADTPVATDLVEDRAVRAVGPQFAIQFIDVWKAYRPGPDVLTGATFRVERGELVVLEGPTGVGKSTVLRLIMGAEHADQGEITVNGAVVHGRATRGLAAIRRSLGLMIQGMPLLPTLTVAENIGLALRAVRARPREARFRIFEVLKDLGLEKRRDAYPPQLSGGEFQRVCLARALVTRPPMLLIDEPTAWLDDTVADTVVSVLKQVHDRGATLVVATHDSEVSSRLRARRLSLDRGRIHASDPKGLRR